MKNTGTYFDVLAENIDPKFPKFFTTPIVNWDKYVNGWRDLPHDKKMALLNKAGRMTNWRKFCPIQKQFLFYRFFIIVFKNISA